MNKEQLSKSFPISNSFNQSLIHKPKNSIITPRLILGILLFLLAVFSQKTLLQTHLQGNLKLNYSMLCGLISQFQVMLSVFLVLFVPKSGYITTLSLNLFACISASIVFLNGNTEVAPGVATYIGTLIIITIIYFLLKKIDAHVQELMERHNELLVLYEEVASSEELLTSQNKQLALCNQMLTEKEGALQELAYYDQLTGLPNRSFLINTLETLINQAKKDKRNFSVVFADLNNFKKINDSMGHLIGDNLLRQIAERWQNLIAKGDILGRLGGDEFALFITHEHSLEEIKLYVETLYHELSNPFYVENKTFYLSASFGIAQYPRDGEDAYKLLKCADLAMYKAKKTAKNNVEFFTSDMQAYALKRLELENLLKNALNNNELYLNTNLNFMQILKNLEASKLLSVGIHLF
ncbi:hypothetical protein CS063_15700 [Sporanaerobium hydrogeniformans]|uniref:Uncharacterized protein n=1 Tax=Sporanaerobium hydrogeniformans TaxID=3072179 RepID=A0AC61D9T6_9FIRM|nr:GGDEF domain-containing protein [Sporanaerobium hydrogeniformans]PHV69441.1 hypothetical protein CS063_15700 [Sporanaerobium hydrogeniformans]